MTNAVPGRPVLQYDEDRWSSHFAESALITDGPVMSLAEFDDWFAERRRRRSHRIRRIPFAELRDWSFQPGTGNLRHRSGRFFAIEGLEVHRNTGPVSEWSQPIINQPEVGTLGLLVRKIDRVPHFLMQVKAEPGNAGGLQLAPTVQATKSNYTRVHGGAAVSYLEHFRRPAPSRVIADVLQSEQGSWFYRKRNRNIVVETGDDSDAGEDFCWLTLGQIHQLLRRDNLVGMDARTVLACLPGPLPGLDGAPGSLHTTREVLSWITGRRAEHELTATRVSLADVRGWHRSQAAISHELGVFFRVIAVDVRTDGREVPAWSQPLIEPHGIGLVALLVTTIDGVPHLLVNTRAEAGHWPPAELAPTVQCTPANYAHMPADAQPRFLDVVLGRRPEQVILDVELSEEGGRFHRARARYVIVEVEGDPQGFEGPDFLWLTLPQATGLLQHGHYVNVQARSLILCLRSLRGTTRRALGSSRIRR